MTATPTDATQTLDQVLPRVLAAVARHAGDGSGLIRADAPLAELDIDSLDQIEIVLDIEATFGVAIPDALIDTLHTPRQMAQATLDALTKRSTLA